MDWGQRRPLVLASLACAVGSLALLVHAWRYWPFLSDDALISLRYVQNWVRGSGLVWNAGERVEGYSNLLWIVGIAGLHRLGIDPIDSARVLAALSGALSVLAVATLPGVSSLSARLFGVTLLASLGAVAIWLVGGLEQPLSSCLLCWVFWLVAREPF